jgi:hypothetical protein
MIILGVDFGGRTSAWLDAKPIIIRLIPVKIFFIAN